MGILFRRVGGRGLWVTVNTVVLLPEIPGRPGDGLRRPASPGPSLAHETLDVSAEPGPVVGAVVVARRRRPPVEAQERPPTVMEVAPRTTTRPRSLAVCPR